MKKYAKDNIFWHLKSVEPTTVVHPLLAYCIIKEGQELVRSPATKVLVSDTKTGHIGKTKDLTRHFQGGGCKDTAQSPLLHIQNVGALCFYTTLVAIHEIVWGENDTVFLINTFCRERETERGFVLKSSVECRLSWL